MNELALFAGGGGGVLGSRIGVWEELSFGPVVELESRHIIHFQCRKKLLGSIGRRGKADRQIIWPNKIRMDEVYKITIMICPQI